MHLPEVEIHPTQVRCFGARASLELESPLAGVLRLRHSPCAQQATFSHPNLPEKTSFAVLTHEHLPLTVREEGAVLHVSAAGVRLELSRSSGRWRFFDADGGDPGHPLVQCVDVSGEATADYPVTRYETRLTLSAPPGEAYLGLGEKVGTLNKRGQRVTFWNTDVMPHHPDTDPLYVSIPMFVGLKDGIAWGLFLDESAKLELDLARDTPEQLSFRSRGPELDVYLFVGPTLKDVLGRYTALTGRAQVPPLWALGAQQSRWGYESETDIRAVIAGYRSRALPLDAVYLDIDHQDGYRSLTFSPARFPNPRALAKDAAAEGVKLIAIVDPALEATEGNPLYTKTRDADLLVRSDRGPVLVGEVWSKPAVFPDFTRAETRRVWGEAHKPFLEAGIAGIWNDMNEPAAFSIASAASNLIPRPSPGSDVGRLDGPTLPMDARHGERRHLDVHNVYGATMSQATFEGLSRLAPTRRPFVLTRSAFAGIQRYAWLWTGDNSSLWSHLELSIPMLLGLGLSGVPFTGADIPGFLGHPNGELLVRWMELGCFYPLMRNHAARGTPFQEPWRFGEPYLSLARELLERRYRLLPTLYSLAEEASRTGAPPLRPLVWSAPADAEALAAWDQLMLGDGLLVAPLTRAEQTRRLLYLPMGAWLPISIDKGGLRARGGVLQGGTHVIAEAPLGETPMYLRAGSTLALTEPALHTTTANWSSLTWHVHAGPRIFGTLYEDAGEGQGPLRRTELHGGYDGDLLWLEPAVTGSAAGALPWARSEVTVVIHGTEASTITAARGTRAARFQAGALVLTLEPGFGRVELDLS